MRIQGDFKNWPADQGPEKKWDESKAYVELPKTSGIEHKISREEFFRPENRDKILALADKLGLDPARMINITLVLENEKTSKEAGQLLRALMIKLLG